MAPNTTNVNSSKMTYRFLGNSGLLVSKFSLGSWMWASDEYTVDAWYRMMVTAFQGGVNFFDTAENYGETLAERNMGGAIKKGIEEGVWSREDLVVTAKLLAGTIAWDQCSPNAQGSCRKHIVEGLRASLGRMQLDYVDVVFCHRADALTPIEETS
ncbi:Aldo/keto reductase family [Phytophthora infestans]|nr:Aldo/keto reductase family [Phytophthora infestans]